MATRPLSTQDNTGSCALLQFPPTISLTSHILASIIALPDDASIIYSVFTGTPPASTSETLKLLENARRSIILCNKKAPILESLLPSVHVNRNSSALYVFAVGPAEQAPHLIRLKELQFSGLTCEYAVQCNVYNTEIIPSSVRVILVQTL